MHCREITDAAAEGTGDAGRAAMARAFRTSSEHELAFWQMGWEGGATAATAGPTSPPHP